MIDIPVYKVPQEYKIKHEVHTECGTGDCCKECSDSTKNKEVYVTEEDGDVGC